MSDQQIVLPHDWEPRSNYQVKPWNYFEGPSQRKRAVLVWHRRAGKDLFGINMCVKEAMKRVGSYWHLFPEYKQAKSAIWNGVTSEGKPYLSHFPPELVDRKFEAETRIRLVNGSNYYLVGSDNYNRLVGTNPVGVILSEYSLQKPQAWQYLSPILAENGGWALFIYTYRGKNHGWIMAQLAKANPEWFFDEQIAGSSERATKRPNGLPVISDEEIDKLRKENVPEAVIQSEFFCNPDAPVEGAYYSKQMQEMKKSGRITTVPYDPRYPVSTAWDIGHDMTVIVFAQFVGYEIRLIDCIFRSDEGLPYFVDRIEKTGYKFDKHYGPWDIDTREWAGGRSRMKIAADLGMKFTVTPQKPGGASLMDGIEQVRLLIPRCVADEKKCDMLLQGLRNFRKEEEKESLQLTGEHAQAMKLFKDHPLHDWASHFDAAMRTLAWNVAHRKAISTVPQERAVDDYQYL